MSIAYINTCKYLFLCGGYIFNHVDITNVIMGYLIKLSEEYVKIQARKIIMNAQVNGGYCFGGFARDELCGDLFHDIDLSFPSESSIDDFINSLKKQYHVKIISKENHHQINSYTKCLKCECITNNGIIKIDCVREEIMFFADGKNHFDLSCNVLKIILNNYFFYEGLIKNMTIQNTDEMSYYSYIVLKNAAVSVGEAMAYAVKKNSWSSIIWGLFHLIIQIILTDVFQKIVTTEKF
jgi:hypothetical protein